MYQKMYVLLHLPCSLVPNGRVGERWPHVLNKTKETKIEDTWEISRVPPPLHCAAAFAASHRDTP